MPTPSFFVAHPSPIAYDGWHAARDTSLSVGQSQSREHR